MGAIKLEAFNDAPLQKTVQLDYRFHVFNSDYVRENLQSQKYCLSGDIEGYIVGKDNIDITEERSRLQALAEEEAVVRRDLIKLVDAAKEEVKNLGASRVSELELLEVEKIMGLEVGPSAFKEKESQLKELNNLPDDVKAPNKLFLNDASLDLGQIKNELAFSYTKAAYSEAFLERVRNHQDFVSSGMQIQDGKTCPFCGQHYDDAAHALIGEYNRYLNDQEAKVVKKLKAASCQLDDLGESYHLLTIQAALSQKDFDIYKMGFNELRELSFPTFPSADEFDGLIKAVKSALAKKAVNISYSADASSVDLLEKALNKVLIAVDEANGFIAKLGTELAKVSNRKTMLKRAVCKEKAKAIRQDNAAALNRLQELGSEQASLKAELSQKEERGKRAKRDAVAQLMTKLLHNVFGDKYIFNTSDYSIVFKDTPLKENADFVLSDGEKAVIAFCFYVSTTYELIDNEKQDADKLFFVIDDPISSLDFNYVYSIIQIIKELDNTFGLKPLRILLLTHNAQFFNMLFGTNALGAAWSLSNQNLTKVKNELITPYDEHLRDIILVANGGEPSHTTGNSMRQILETLMHFEMPANDKLSDYLANERNNDLREVEYLYVLCNDQSHGTRTAGSFQTVDSDSVRRACRAILKHLDLHYPGQLEAIEYALSGKDG